MTESTTGQGIRLDKSNIDPTQMNLAVPSSNSLLANPDFGGFNKASRQLTISSQKNQPKKDETEGEVKTSAGPTEKMKADEKVFILSEKYQKKAAQITFGSSVTMSIAEYPSCYIYSDGFSSKTIKIKQFNSAQGSRELDFFNTVFQILPSMEHKFQKQLLSQFVFPETKVQQGTEDLQKRKQQIQSLQQNIQGEFNANTLLFNKLKGTPVLFSTSSFHLVHKASLKYLSIEDEFSDNYTFKFVDFPDQNCLFKFLPCLMYQKQRSNTVYGYDSLYIVSSKQIHNRKPFIFTDYSGQPDVNKIDVFSEESSYGKIYANLETQFKWRINLFQESETDDLKYTLNVGDSIWLNLSEHHYVVSAIQAANVDQRIKNTIYSIPSDHASTQQQQQQQNQQQGQGPMMMSHVSDNQLGLNPSKLNKSPVSPNLLGASPLATSAIIQPDKNNIMNRQPSLQNKMTRQVTLQNEFLTPNYQKSNTLQVEDQPQNYQMTHSASNFSRISRQMSGISTSKELEEDDDYDENLEGLISDLENEIFQITNVEFSAMNFEDQQLQQAQYQQMQQQQLGSGKNNPLQTIVNSSRKGDSDEEEEEEERKEQEQDEIFQQQLKQQTAANQQPQKKSQASQQPQADDNPQYLEKEPAQMIQTQGLWKIESEYFLVGGFLEWKSVYRLKHFTTGKYLTLDTLHDGNHQLRMTRNPTGSSLFQFCKLKGNADSSKNKYISKDSFYMLKNVMLDLYISIDQLAYLEQSKIQLKASSEQSQFSVFKMKKANFDDIWETNFLLCCIPILTESIKFLNRLGRKSNLEKFIRNRQQFEQIFSKIKQVLQDIDSFVYNTLVSNISVTEEYGKPSSMRSNILREQHVLGILCLMLFKTFPREEQMKNLNMEQIQERVAQDQKKNIGSASFTTNQYNNQSDGGAGIGGQKKPHMKMLEDVLRKKYNLCFMIYRILQKVCYDNISNQQYLFKFLTEFQKQIGNQDLVCDSLISFFKENKMLIQQLSIPFKPIQPKRIVPKHSHTIIPLSQPSETKITGSHMSFNDEKTTHLNMVISKLYYYRQSKKSDILKLLSAFCKYLDTAIFNNQEMIFNNLIGMNHSNKSSPLFQLSLQNGDTLTIRIENGSDVTFTPIAEFVQFEVEAGSNQQGQDGNIDEEVQDEFEEPEKGIESASQQQQAIGTKNYSFLMQQLNLFANLCLNRNFHCCSYFQEIFPLKTLISHIENEHIDNEFKAAFLKLIHYIYLDKEPRQVSIKPNFLRVIDQDFEGQNSAVADHQPGQSQQLGQSSQVQVQTQQPSSQQQIPQLLTSPQQNQYQLQINQQQGYDSKTPINSASTNNNVISNKNGEIELQTMPLLGLWSKQNKMSQYNQEAVEKLMRLEGKERLAGKSDQDESELQSLKKLKTDLLNFLLKKDNLLNSVNRDTQDKIFNVMTLEAIKILKMMLKFGIFAEEEEMINQAEKQKKKTNAATLAATFLTSKLVNVLGRKEEQKPKTEIHKLVDICSKLLEYDQFYMETLQQLKIIRRSEETRLRNESINLNPLNLKFVSNGMNLLGQGLDGVKNLFDFSVNPSKDEKKEQKKKQALQNDVGTEAMADPLFKKVQGLKKVLFKYTNKTYLSKSELKEQQEEDYETEIKIQICQIFHELLNVQQDFFLDNTISFFKQHFNSIKSKNSSVANQISTLLPPDLTEIGGEYFQDEEFVNYSDRVAPMSFDQILERSFMETLLISFYFAENSVLGNEIMNLIRRTCMQKHEFVSNIGTIELLLTPESKRSYKQLSYLTNQLKNLIQNSQIWMQIQISKESNAKIQQTLSILNQISQELTFENYLNSDMKVAQTIFKHIKGDEMLLLLIERGFLLFHSNKEAFFEASIAQNGKVDHVLATINNCFNILILFCRNNPTYQEQLFDSVFQHLVKFKIYNFGQIPLLYEIIQGNLAICSQMKIEDLKDLADYILQHGKYSRFLYFFEIILQNTKSSADRQSKILRSAVMKIIFDDRLSQKINPFLESEASQQQRYSQNQKDQHYCFFDEAPDIRNYKDLLIKLMAKGLNKDSEISIVSKMNKNVTADHLLGELLLAQAESLQYEKSKEKQHLTPIYYKKQRKILKILLFYFSKSQKDYLEQQIRGNMLLFQFIQITTDRLREENLFPIDYQISLIDRVVPLINIYSELFLKDINLSLTDSQDVIALSKNYLTLFAFEYIRQVEIFNREYEAIFVKEVRIRQLMRLSAAFSVPVPKSLGGLKNILEGKEGNNESDFGLEEKRNQSYGDSSSSVFSKKKMSFQQYNTSKKNQSVTERSKQGLLQEQDEDFLLGEPPELKGQKSKSVFNPMNQNNNGQSEGQGQRDTKPKLGSRLLKLIGQTSKESTPQNKLLDANNIQLDFTGKAASKNEEQLPVLVNTRAASSIQKLFKFVKNESKKEKEEVNITQAILEGWDYIKQLLNEDEDIQEIVKEEESALSTNILAVQSIFMIELNDNQKDILLNPEDLLTKCLNYIEFWQINHSEKSDVIFVIKSLSKLLKLEDEEEELKIERQNMLDRLNATKISLLLISDSSESVDYDMLYFIIKFFVLILDGGNEQVQKTIYQFFLGNTVCEQFFSRVNAMISDQIVQETTGHKHITGGKGDKIIQKILRLLQLFSEGHNQDLQNYVRNQANNKKSYDFVSLVIKLLSTYKIHNDNFDTVIQCFDTLTEFIQGPCSLNQQQILNSKFLDYAVLILNGDPKILDLEQIKIQKKKEEDSASQPTAKKTFLFWKKSEAPLSDKKSVSQKEVKKQDNGEDGKEQQEDQKIEQKSQSLHAGKLARLKNKCLITIVSLLECNINNEQFVTKIMRTIPLTVLTDNLSRIYELYQKYEKGYSERLFNRADDDIDLTKPEEYSELIIENGFSLYILVNLFLENKKAISEEDDELQEYIEEFSNAEKDEGLTGLLKNNILFDLSKMGTAFLGMGMGALKDIYKKTVNLGGDSALEEEERKKLDELEKKEKRKNAIKFFKDQVTRIEIVRDDQLQFIYFPILPFCKMLPNELNMDFRENVSRTSTKTKLASLMSKSYYMIKVMKHEERLRLMFEQYKLLGYVATNIKMWEKIAFIIACIINIIVLFSYTEWYQNDPGAKSNARLTDPRLFFIKDQTSTIDYIIALGIVDMVFYSIVVAVFLMKKAPILIGDIWESYYKLYNFDFINLLKKKKKKRGEHGGGAMPLQLVGALTTHALDIFNKVLLFAVNALKSGIIMFSDVEIVYYMFNMLIVICGLTVHPFLFAGCMSDILRTKQLKNVVSAIWKPRSEIVLLLVLFVIFQYYFTLFAYILFNDHFSDNRCDALWRCFITVFDWTFKQNGGVGALMKEPKSLAFYMDEQQVDESSVSFKGTLEQFYGIYFMRFVYDNFNNILLLFILINILKGIIVDKFRSLKDEVQQRDIDEKYLCFVCGISREVLDKAQLIPGFAFHIKKEHQMWNYVYYRAYLEFKESTEYNGDESYVRDKIDDNDLSWFPVKRTWSVQQKEDSEIDSLHEEVVENLKEVNELAKDSQLKFLSTIEQISTEKEDDENLETASSPVR